MVKISNIPRPTYIPARTDDNKYLTGLPFNSAPFAWAALETFFISS